MAAPLTSGRHPARVAAAGVAAVAIAIGSTGGREGARPAAAAAEDPTPPSADPCPGEPGRTRAVTVRAGGRRRVGLVHVPAVGERGDPAPRPLVLAFHPAGPPGGRVKAAIFEEETRWSRLADEHGVVVVYPVGLGRDASSWRPERDLPFVRALLGTLVATGCVDPARVHAAGASNGAAMAAAAACEPRLRVASVALVSLRAPPASCSGAEPVPVVGFHGRRDSLVAFADAKDAAGAWAARRDGCTDDVSKQTLAPDVEHWTWPRCTHAFELYALRDHGHAWPGLSRARFEETRERAGRPATETARVARYLRPFRASLRAEVVAWEFFAGHG